MNVLLCMAVVKGATQNLLWDHVGWRGSKDRLFTVKSTNNVRAEVVDPGFESHWRTIHKFRAIQRICTFWPVCHNKLMTNEEQSFKFKVVPAAGGRVNEKLILKNEATMLNDVMNCDETFDGNGGITSFPRSYYRCTITSCNVKKRLERSFSDPSIVITTYEGQHTNLSPTMPRSCLAAGAHLSSGISAAATGASGFGMAVQRTPSHFQQPFGNTLSPLNFGQNGSFLNPSF
ncbi:hypothetical protein V6N13_147991 [Hibiscus sabdariffa]